MTRHFSILLAACALLLSACVSAPKPMAGPVLAAPVAAAGQQAYRGPPATTALSDYRVASQDVLRVMVLGEPQLTFDEVLIDERGGFLMPIVGRVDAVGNSVDTITESIRRTLAARYLRDPVVAVNIVNTASRVVTVEGAVKTPGVFQFRPGATLLSAMALSGGPVRTAQLNEVVVFRPLDGQPAAALFDLRQVRAGTMIDPVLMPGDRIVVGTSARAQAWQDILQALPVLTVFTLL